MTAVNDTILPGVSTMLIQLNFTDLRLLKIASMTTSGTKLVPSINISENIEPLATESSLLFINSTNGSTLWIISYFTESGIRAIFGTNRTPSASNSSVCQTASSSILLSLFYFANDHSYALYHYTIS